MSESKIESTPEALIRHSRGSVILNVIVGIAAVTGVGWLVMHCPTCHLIINTGA